MSLQPITQEDPNNQDEEFECSEGFSYEDVSNQQPETRLQQTCHRRGNEGGMLMVNIVPVKDAVTFKHTGGAGENFDVPFVLHLWPSILLRNLLPYPISYKLKVRCASLSLLRWVFVDWVGLHTSLFLQHSYSYQLVVAVTLNTTACTLVRSRKLTTMVLVIQNVHMIQYDVIYPILLNTIMSYKLHVKFLFIFFQGFVRIIAKLLLHLVSQSS